MDRPRLTTVTIFLGLVLVCSIGLTATAAPTDAPAFVKRARIIEPMQLGIPYPAGLAFSPKAGTLLVVRRPIPGAPPGPVGDIELVTLAEQRAGTVRIAAGVTDPVNMAFDPKANRLLILQSPNHQLIEILARPDGSLDPQTLTRIDARPFGLEDPQGLTVDPASGHLLILDAAGPRIVRVEPHPQLGFESPIISEMDLAQTGLSNLRGLAFDPTNGHLHVLDPAAQELHELTETGQIVATRDLSEFGFRNPQGMTFAPSGDTTDDPSQMNLYIADSGMGTSATPGSGSTFAESGQISELSLVETAAAAAATASASLIQIIDTSQFSPPSPDPAGITYLENDGHLLISDSEVNEMSIFTGDNLFEVSLPGSLIDTSTTTGFSNEPTGTTWNPMNMHLFISDDDQREIFEVNPGSDGRYGTSDDSVTSFDTRDFGSNDPEGVTYDSLHGFLFIVDGNNREVYRVSPGSNGVFDGVPSAGDDVVTSFDTLNFGLDDPEGIAFNPDSGHLYIVGQPVTSLFEVTTEGTFVGTIDISAANAVKPAGLAVAPSSVNPGEMSLWIVDRVVDNNDDHNENDGKAYEFSLPSSGGEGNQATFTPVADTFVSSGTPDTIYGASPRIEIDGSPTKIAYLRFNVTGLSGAVQSARLRLEVLDASTSGGAIHSLSDDSWDEGTVTYNTRPSDNLIGPALDTLGAVSVGNIVELDVTAAIAGNGIYSFAMDSNSSNGADYRSREDLPNPPTLVIVTGSGGPANTAPTITSSPVTTATVGQPYSYDVDATDPDTGDTLTYSLETAPGGATINSSTGLISWTPTAGQVGDHSFTVRATDDGAGPLFDEQSFTVTVSGGGGGATLEVRVSATSDDAEEHTTGTMESLSSSDLEMVEESDQQIVGMRFLGLTIPQGATITNAYIEFQVDETDSVPTNLTFRAQAIDDAPTFTSSANNISSRATTTASVAWNNVAAWSSTGQTHQTPDLSTIIQEVTDRQGWSSGNDLVVIVTGTSGSKRVAESYDGVAAAAPLLHVDYLVGSPSNTPPQITNGPTATPNPVDEDQTAQLSVTATDGDNDPLTYTWTASGGSIAGTGPTVTYTPPDVSTQQTFTITVEVADGHGGMASGSVGVTVNPVGGGGSQATFAPVADTFVNSASPNTNYGSVMTLEVDARPTKIAYLRFNVTNLSGAVQSARLRLEVVNASRFGGTIYSMSDTSWDEGTVTFNSRPSIDGSALDALGRVRVGDIVELDVTEAISGNGIYSFAMDSINNNGADYRSREDLANPPVLIITTN